MAGDPRMYCPAFRHWMRALAAQGISMRVMSVGYPLAPENPFPAPVLAAAAAYRWLVGQLKAEGRSDAVVIGEPWQLLLRGSGQHINVSCSWISAMDVGKAGRNEQRGLRSCAWGCEALLGLLPRLMAAVVCDAASVCQEQMQMQ